MFDDIDDDHGGAAFRADEGRERACAVARALICIVMICIDGCWRGMEQFTGLSQAIVADGVGEKAVVSNAVESLWQDVDEETADELAGIEGHSFVAVSLFGPVIFPLEGDAVIILGDQAGVGDGDAMGISGEVSQHHLGPVEGSFGIEVPLEFAKGLDELGEVNRVSKVLMLAEELQLTILMGAGELFEEQAAEQSGQDTHGEEESRPAGDPALAVEGESTTGDDAVDMGVMGKA